MLRSSFLIPLILLSHALFTVLGNNYSSLTINSIRSRTKSAQSCALFTQNRRDQRAKSFQEHLDRQARVGCHHGHHNHNRRLLKPSGQDNNGRPKIVIHHFHKKDCESDQGECSKRNIALEIYAKRLNMTLQNRSEVDDGSSRLIGTPHKSRSRIIAALSKTTDKTHSTGIIDRSLKSTAAPIHNAARKVKSEKSYTPKGNHKGKLTSTNVVTLPTVTKSTATRGVSKGIGPKSNTPHVILTKVFVIPIQEEEPKNDASDTLKTVKIALNKAAKRSEPQDKKYPNEEYKKKRKKSVHHSTGKRKFRNYKNLNKNTNTIGKKENRLKRKKIKHYTVIRHYKRPVKGNHLKRKNRKFRAKKKGSQHSSDKKLHKHHNDQLPKSEKNEFGS